MHMRHRRARWQQNGPSVKTIVNSILIALLFLLGLLLWSLLLLLRSFFVALLEAAQSYVANDIHKLRFNFFGLR